MNDAKLRDLLTDVADGVEPGDRLGAIVARTRRSRSRLWVPAGAALVAASVVGAVALSSAPAHRDASGPAGSSTSPPDPPAPSSPASRAPSAVAVYYVGDTPDGPRLYREFRRLEGDALDAASLPRRGARRTGAG